MINYDVSVIVYIIMIIVTITIHNIYIQLIRTITFWIGSSWLLDNILPASAPALAHEKWKSSEKCFRGLEKCSSHTVELFA